MSSERSPGPAIEAVNLGKRYEIYARPIDRLKQSLYRHRRQFFVERWALCDVSFSVAPGEIVAVIGTNGSGKSTLLQMVAGTLHPTTGSVRVRGRVTSILELGSGFNPEFTGRDNVFLNAAILGLARKETEARFAEIAAFADIGVAIDEPVKTYSTGMLMRLAFAVQVLLDPDVLLVDEALAVGDVAFQAKCMIQLRRMIERGVTVLFVTHDVQVVRTHCQRAIWLDHGRVRADGAAGDVTAQYLRAVYEPAAAALAAEASADVGMSAVPTKPGEALPGVEGRSDLVRWGAGGARVVGVRVNDCPATARPTFDFGARLRVEMEVAACRDFPEGACSLAFAIRNAKGQDVIIYTSFAAGRRIGALRAGERVRLTAEFENILQPGAYSLIVAVEDRGDGGFQYQDFIENAVLFRCASDRQILSLVLPPVDDSLRRCA